MHGTGNGHLESNQGQIKVIVRTLAVIAPACVLGIFVLVFYGKTVPTEMWLLTSNVVTALISMLVKTTPTVSAPPEQPKPAGEITVSAQKLETTT